MQTRRNNTKWAFRCRPTVFTLGMVATHRTGGLFGVAKRSGVEKKLSMRSFGTSATLINKLLATEAARWVCIANCSVIRRWVYMTICSGIRCYVPDSDFNLRTCKQNIYSGTKVMRAARATEKTKRKKRRERKTKNARSVCNTYDLQNKA